MRSKDGWGAAVGLSVLTACSGEAGPPPAGQIAAVARLAEVGQVAATVAPERAAPRVRVQAPVDDVPPATFAGLRERWQQDPAAVAAMRFSRGDLARLFADRAPSFDTWGGSHLVADLDRDGVEEALVAVGKGWWEDGYDLHMFAAHGPASHGPVFRLASSQRVAAHGRWPPGLCPVAGDRPGFFTASRTSGTGTGICTVSRQLFELVGGRAVEVLRLLADAEYAPYGTGPSFEVRAGTFEVTTDAAGAAVLRPVLHVGVWSGLGAGFDDEWELELALELRQGWRGGPFLLQRPAGWRLEDLDLEPLMAIGMRAWFERHETAALRLAAEGTAAQQVVLRRACEVARLRGPHAVADAVRARLPEEPAERR